MKGKLQEMFGTVGIVLFAIIRISVSVLPFVMIDVPFLLTFLFIAISVMIPGASIIFWVWGLICAIMGPQDIFAIIYYVLFVVIFLPTFISIINDMLNKNKQHYDVDDIEDSIDEGEVLDEEYSEEDEEIEEDDKRFVKIMGPDGEIIKVPAANVNFKFMYPKDYKSYNVNEDKKKEEDE